MASLVSSFRGWLLLTSLVLGVAACQGEVKGRTDVRGDLKPRLVSTKAGNISPQPAVPFVRDAPATPATLELTGLPDPLTAGAATEVHVRVLDALGNVAIGYTGTLRFTSTDPRAVLPDALAFTRADAGEKTVPGPTLKSAGSSGLTVVDQDNAALTASVTIRVVAGAPSQLAFTQQPGQQSVRAGLEPVKVALFDAFGNPTAASSPSVTMALNPFSAGLHGTMTVASAEGMAAFTTLGVAGEGSGYQLLASAEGLTPATSHPFDIVDDVAPSQPVLEAGDLRPTSIVVRWTAVGDDGDRGTVMTQELRYATSPIITDADFSAATLVTTDLPRTAGSLESATLSDLTPDTGYSVALKVTDNAGNTARSASLTVSTERPLVTRPVSPSQPVDGTAGTAPAEEGDGA